MPRQKTGEKLGRPFIYTTDEERPVTVSLRIKRALFDRLETYRKIHRQSVTELLIEGLKWRLDEETDPRWPSQNGTQHYGNTAMREEVSDRQPALTPEMLNTADVDDMPLEPVDIHPQLAQSAPPVLDFDTRVWCLRPPSACGHTSHGEAGNRVRCSDPRKCWQCEAEATAQKKAAKAHRPTPSMQEG